MFASLSAPLRKISAPAMGMSAMCLAMLLLPVGDTLTKSLTTIIAPAEVAALRASVLTLALAVAYLALRGMAWGKVISIWSMISACTFTPAMAGSTGVATISRKPTALVPTSRIRPWIIPANVSDFAGSKRSAADMTDMFGRPE